MAIVALMATVVSSFVANAIVPIRPLAFPSLAPVSPPVLADTAARLAKFEENLEAKLDRRISIAEARIDSLEAKLNALEQSTLAAIASRRHRMAAAIGAASLAANFAAKLMNGMTAGESVLTANVRWYIARQTAYMFAGSFAVLLWFVKVMVLVRLGIRVSARVRATQDAVAPRPAAAIAAQVITP